MKPAVCPSSERLADFLLGKLPELESSAVAEHLEHCQECQEAAAQIDQQADTLLTALNATQGTSVPEACQRMMAKAEQLVEQPTAEPAPSSHVPEELRQIRDYRLLAKLGQGGMGAVYKARHVNLKRLVALKLLPVELMRDPQAVARFRREMEAVGRLVHPNIVMAHDAGESGGRHFLVMEYVEGIDLSELVRRVGPLPIADACELIRQAAVGLQHAHEHGLVHRDIKPSNLMVTGLGGQPSAISSLNREPAASASETPTLTPLVKILDLGLALLGADAEGAPRELTSTGQLMGTIDYMAPEQGGDSHEVDIRADIYSLGATLYKLLTGEAPFGGQRYNTPLKKLKALASEEVPSIGTKRIDLPEELAQTVDRMLAKNPDNRFATPHEVATALGAFSAKHNLAQLLSESADPTAAAAIRSQSTISTSDDLSSSSTPSVVTPEYEPTQTASVKTGRHEHDNVGWAPPTVEPVSAKLRSRRHAGRKPVRKLLALGAAAAALLVSGVVITIQLTDKGTVVIEYDGQSKDELSVAVLEGGQEVKVLDKSNNWSVDISKGEYRVSLRGGNDRFELKNDRIIVRRGEREVVRVKFVERSVGVADPIASETVSVVPRTPIADGKPGEVLQLNGHDGEVQAVAFSPDGRHVLTAGRDFTLKLWDVQVGEAIRKFEGHSSNVNCVAFSPDGRYALSGASKPDSSVRLWDLATGDEVQVFRGHVSTVTSVDFSLDGQLAVSSGFDATFPLWDVRTGKEVRRFVGHEGGVTQAIFSPSGQQILSVSFDGSVRLWDIETGRQMRQLQGSTAGVTNATFSPDGRRVLTGETATRIWNVNTGETISALKGHQLGVEGLAFLPDGRHVITGSWDKTIRIWNLETGIEVHRFKTIDPNLTLDVSPDGRFAVSAAPTRWGGDGKMMTAGETVARIWRLPKEVWAQTKAKPEPQRGSNLALQFDGKDDYVEIPSLKYDGSHPITMEAVITPLANGVIVSNTEAAGIDLQVGSPHGRPMFQACSKQRGYIHAIGDRLTLHVTAHLAGEFDGQSVTLYVNGKCVQTNEFTGQHRPSGLSFAFGHTPPRGLNFRGRIQEVRISKIMRYRGADFTPRPHLESDEHTLALYHFDEGQGDVLKDSSGNGHHGKIVGARWVTVDEPTLGDASSRAIDLLRLIDAKRDGVVGKWTKPDALIGVTDDWYVTWLQVPYVPPEEYDLNLVVHVGERGALIVGLVAGENRFRVAVDRYADQQGATRHTTFGDVDRPADEYAGRVLTPDQPNDVRFQLRKDGLRIVCNDQQIINWQGDPRSADLALGLYQTAHPHCLVIGGLDQLRIDRMELVPVTGEGAAASPPTKAIAPFDSSQAKVLQEAWANFLDVPVEWENSIGMNFRLVPPGEFLMGSSDEEIEYVRRHSGLSKWHEHAHQNEGPLHRVVITRPFYMGQTVVTVGQFRRFVDESAYRTEAELNGLGGISWRLNNKREREPGITWRSPGTPQTDQHPVVQVSWNDTQAFCHWLSQVEGIQYSLPTEAQWEYACRAGTATRWFCGDDPEQLIEFAWYHDGSWQRGDNVTTAVAQKKPNPFGLFDMHGGVWQWCADWHAKDYYRTSPLTDPIGPSEGQLRVERGGSHNNAWLCRSAHRNADEPTYCSNVDGFRVLCVIDETLEATFD